MEIKEQTYICTKCECKCKLIFCSDKEPVTCTLGKNISNLLNNDIVQWELKGQRYHNEVN